MLTGLLVLILLVMPASASAGSVFKCLVDGKTRYSDQPCGGKSGGSRLADYGRPAPNAAAKEVLAPEADKGNAKPANKAPGDLMIEAREKDENGNEVTTAGARFVGAGDDFDCNDPAYANVKKVESLTIIAPTGMRKLCRDADAVKARRETPIPPPPGLTGRSQ